MTENLYVPKELHGPLWNNCRLKTLKFKASHNNKDGILLSLLLKVLLLTSLTRAQILSLSFFLTVNARCQNCNVSYSYPVCQLSVVVNFYIELNCHKHTISTGTLLRMGDFHLNRRFTKKWETNWMPFERFSLGQDISAIWLFLTRNECKILSWFNDFKKNYRVVSPLFFDSLFLSNIYCPWIDSPSRLDATLWLIFSCSCGWISPVQTRKTPISK